MPLCKRNLNEILKSQFRDKLVLSFGGNWIGINEKEVEQDLNNTIEILKKNRVSFEQCFFVTPTYEMQVVQRRSVPRRTLEAVNLITMHIAKKLEKYCQILRGTELMQDSPLLDSTQKTLKRIPVTGDPGCMGKAVNDNVHVCGEAAKELAEKLCHRLIQ